MHTYAAIVFNLYKKWERNSVGDFYLKESN